MQIKTLQFKRIKEYLKSIVFTKQDLNAIDLVNPWKMISKNNYWIVIVTVFVFFIHSVTSTQYFDFVSIVTSLFASLPIGFTLAFLETRTNDFKKLHRRTPFILFLFIKTLRNYLYLIGLYIIIALIVNLFYSFQLENTIFSTSISNFFSFRNFTNITLIALITSTITNFISDIKRKLGTTQLQNLIFGTYHQPKSENRLFLFVDLNDSTVIAEKLGELKYSHLLQDMFYDMGNPIVLYEGEIYQYVGDEIVATWTWTPSSIHKAIACFFAVEEELEKYHLKYMSKYGIVPAIKCSIHGGAVVVAEVGKFKAEIAYHGDVVNTSARMIGLCHQLKTNFITTKQVLDQTTLKDYINIKPLGAHNLKGKQNEVELFSLSLNKVKYGYNTISEG